MLAACAVYDTAAPSRASAALAAPERVQLSPRRPPRRRPRRGSRRAPAAARAASERAATEPAVGERVPTEPQCIKTSEHRRFCPASPRVPFAFPARSPCACRHEQDEPRHVLRLPRPPLKSPIALPRPVPTTALPACRHRCAPRSPRPSGASSCRTQPGTEGEDKDTAHRS